MSQAHRSYRHLGRQVEVPEARTESLPGAQDSADGSLIIECSQEASFEFRPHKVMPGFDTTLLCAAGSSTQWPESVQGVIDAAISRAGDPLARAADTPVTEGVQLAAPGLEQVHGTDDRSRVTQTTQYPWHAVCYLEITTARNALLAGTGWLVGPRMLVTAGHNLFRHDEGGQPVRSVVVFPGRNGIGSAPFRSQRAAKLCIPRGYRTSRAADVDYGAILLDRPFEGVGDFGYDVYTDSQLNGETLNIVGYPGLQRVNGRPGPDHDKPPATMWGHARPVRAGHRTLTYLIDTTPGQSGSPVFDLIEHNGRTHYIGVGIHNGGHHSGNVAARITDEVAENIEKWQASVS